MSKTVRFTDENFIVLCDTLSLKDVSFKKIIDQYGYPPCWSRKPSFATLIHIILEQQVSLASAKAAFDKLQLYIKTITPENILRLSDEEMKACYFSRQKIKYARCLSEAVVQGDLKIEDLILKDDETIRATLKKIKGIGDWTVDVFLMMCLHSADIFPFGDIALVNSLKHIKQLPSDTVNEELMPLTALWSPYRTIAAYLLWHKLISVEKESFISHRNKPAAQSIAYLALRYLMRRLISFSAVSITLFSRVLIRNNELSPFLNLKYSAVSMV